MEEALKPYSNLIISAIFIAFACMVLCVVWVMDRIKKRPWLKLASTFGSLDVFSRSFSPGFIASYHGMEFSVKIGPGWWYPHKSFYRIPCFQIILNKMTPLRLTVRRQSGSLTDEFFEALGIAKDIRTGDPVFDQEFAIASTDPAGAARFFLVPETKNAVRDILSIGFDAVILDGKTTVAYMDRCYIADITMEHARIASVLDGLILIASRAG